MTDFDPDEFRYVVERLARFAHARDRQADRELRTITLTDDEAATLLKAMTADTWGLPIKDDDPA